MKTINRVMACVDFSDYSLETIESALAIGKGHCPVSVLSLNLQ